MKVKKLISLLKKCDPDLEVYTSAHDNLEWELAGSVNGVDIFDKDEDPGPPLVDTEDREWYNSNPQRAVVLRG